MVDHKSIYSAMLKVESGSGDFSWKGAAGEAGAEDKYFIASVTKLFMTAVVMKLVEEEKLSLDDRIEKHLPKGYCDGLHTLKGKDYSKEIVVRHLISNTSGIPDYFFHKQKDGRTVADELMEGKDEEWPIEKTLGLIKQLRPNFKPGARGKASYSDSNYQLLGKLLENIAQMPISGIFQKHVFEELGLKNTYVYTDPEDSEPLPFYYGSKKLWLPRYMTSIAPEGGIVSTLDEMMVFLKAFFAGHFFPKEKIESLKQWNMIWPPPGLFKYGIGLENLWIPWILSPIKHPGEILGFWGQTASFAFYNPKSDLYFCGTANQVNGKGHRAATTAMIKTIKSAL